MTSVAVVVVEEVVSLHSLRFHSCAMVVSSTTGIVEPADRAHSSPPGKTEHLPVAWLKLCAEASFFRGYSNRESEELVVAEEVSPSEGGVKRLSAAKTVVLAEVEVVPEVVRLVPVNRALRTMRMPG